MSNSKIIENINIEGKNNDLIDFYEQIIKSIFDIGDNKQEQKEIFKIVNNKLTNLRSVYQNKKILFTENEKEEVNILFKQILQQAEISTEQKISKIIQMLDYNIRREIQEVQDRQKHFIHSPQEIINKIKNLNLQDIAEIGDINIGTSPYIVIITPVLHIDPIDDQFNKKNFERIQKTQLNSLKLKKILYENGICKTFALESCNFKEFAEELPHDIYFKNQELINLYLEYQKNPSINKEKIAELESDLQFLDEAINFILEKEYQLEVYTYGIENFTSNNLSAQLNGFYDQIKNIEEMNEQELQIKIDTYLQSVRQNLESNKQPTEISDQDINLLIEKLAEIICLSKSKAANYKQFKNLIHKAYFLLKAKYINADSKFNYQNYQHKISTANTNRTYEKRHEDIVKSTQQIYENTHTNAINVPIGVSHVKNETDGAYYDSLLDQFKKKNITTICLRPKGLNKKYV